MAVVDVDRMHGRRLGIYVVVCLLPFSTSS